MNKPGETSSLNQTVADELICWLRDHGIRHVFGTPSGAWLPYLDAMRTGDVEFVLASNEGAAGFMAVVYSWLKGVPGACYATIGPGATNLSTGVGCALLNRTPMVAFTTELPGNMTGRIVQMAIDQQKLFTPITKMTTRLDPAAVRDTMDHALSVATSGLPGPVHIGLPEDIGVLPASTGTTEQTGTTAQTRTTEQTGGAPPEAAILAMEKAFRNAQKPVLAIGLGAVRTGCSNLIRAVASRHRVPVVLTPMAKGVVPEDHPSYAGVLFHALSDHVAMTHRQADLVVAVGYDPVEFNFESWMPEAGLINIDVQPADIDRAAFPEVLNVTGTISVALERMMELEPLQSAWDFDALAERRSAMFARFTPAEGAFGPVEVLHALRNHLPQDGIMTCDVGAHTHLIGQMWQTPEPRTQLMDNGWSSMGFGVPAAIAAKIARPDVEVACVTGDGGFLMMAGEMATARRLGSRIVFVLLSDGSLELINIKQKRKALSSYGTSLVGRYTPPGPPSEIFGVPVIPAYETAGFNQALKTAFAADGPSIVQAFIDPSGYDDLIMKSHR